MDNLINTFFDFIGNNFITIVLVVGGLFGLLFFLALIWNPCIYIYKTIVRAFSNLGKKAGTKNSVNVAKKRSFKWTYDIPTRTLTISGDGYMPKYWHPWPQSLIVNNLIITDGVLSICDNAFKGIDMDNCAGIQLGNTLEIVGASAFGKIGKIRKIIFPKTLKLIKSGAFTQVDAIFCFKAANPPKLGKGALARGEIQVPEGCFNNYVTSTSWSLINANCIRERIDSLMGFTDDEIRKENQRLEEEKRREEMKRKKEEEAKKRQEEEMKRKEEEEVKKRQEEEMKRKEEERKRQEEAKRKEEEERKEKEEEVKKRQEEEMKRKEEERKRQEDAKRKEEKERKEKEEEVKKRQEEEMKRKEEERKRQEEARKKEEEERKKKEEEAAYAAKYEAELRKKMGL